MNKLTLAALAILGLVLCFSVVLSVLEIKATKKRKKLAEKIRLRRKSGR